jgi:hypothetical protein
MIVELMTLCEGNSEGQFQEEKKTQKGQKKSYYPFYDYFVQRNIYLTSEEERYNKS